MIERSVLDEISGRRSCAVWKYMIEPREGEYVLEIPDNSNPISVQPQHGKIAIWVLVDLNSAMRKYKFRVLMTGTCFSISENWVYHGTCLFDDGNYVAHVWEDLEDEHEFCVNRAGQRHRLPDDDWPEIDQYGDG